MQRPLFCRFVLIPFFCLSSLVLGQNDVLEPVDPSEENAPQEELEDPFGFQQIEMLAYVIELIRQNYHDEDKIGYDQLIQSALEGMLASLDPHSQFMGKDLFSHMKRQTGGTYDGVGITIAVRNEILTVVSVREDGPAARAGILPGDQIRKINDTLTEKMSLQEAIQIMQGKPGEVLRLTIHRRANNKVLEFEMVREVMREATVVDVQLLHQRYAGSHRIGYTRITQFGARTVQELVEGLNQLESEGMEAFVLDMRNNPGGLLSSAVNTCGEFIPEDTLVLTTEGREAVANTKEFRTPKRKAKLRTYPMAVLVNHSSASGAEVVSGALQDLRRAVIVGEPTFGKGSVQSIIPIPRSEGAAVRLTTAKYYTPSKRTIHENGVKPDLISTLTPEDERNMLRWFRRSLLSEEDRKKIEEWHDRQLARAVDVLKGTLIYAKLSRPATNPAQQEAEGR